MEFVSKISRKKVSLLFTRLLLFLVILFLLDLSIGRLMKYFYFKQTSGLLYRTTYSIDSTNAEILIFGSSTANHHYYPDSFEKRMNMSLYNAGRDGISIFYHYSILRCVLKRYSPKMVILDFNIGEFKKDAVSYERMSSLLPYYEDYPEIRPIIQLKSPYEKYKLLSKIYPYNSLLFTIAVGNADFNRNREYVNSNDGYIPLKKIWNKKITINSSDTKYEIDSNKVNMFKYFIRDCANSGVKLYIIISPRFFNYTFEDSSIKIANNISKEFNIQFFDFSNSPEFLNNPNLFADRYHLNDSGAKVYSNRVIDSIMNEKQ